MKIMETVAGAVGNLLDNVKPGSALDEIFEFIGIQEPGELVDLLTADGLGDLGQQFYEALGYDEEFAAAFGAAGDISTGNVMGAASKGAEALGQDEVASAVDLAGQLPI